MLDDEDESLSSQIVTETDKETSCRRSRGRGMLGRPRGKKAEDDLEILAEERV